MRQILEIEERQGGYGRGGGKISTIKRKKEKICQRMVKHALWKLPAGSSSSPPSALFIHKNMCTVRHVRAMSKPLLFRILILWWISSEKRPRISQTSGYTHHGRSSSCLREKEGSAVCSCVAAAPVDVVVVVGCHSRCCCCLVFMSLLLPPN